LPTLPKKNGGQSANEKFRWKDRRLTLQMTGNSVALRKEEKRRGLDHL